MQIKSISKFEIIGTVFTFCNSRTKSESPKTEFIDIVKILMKMRFILYILNFIDKDFKNEFNKVISKYTLY